MRITMRFLYAVKMGGVLTIFQTWVQIRTAAKPPTVWGPEHTCVHVYSWTMWVLHMRHKADAACPKTRIFFHPRQTLARGHGVLRALSQLAINGGDIYADFLEHTPATHHRHQTTASIRSIGTAALGLSHFKSASGLIGKRTLGMAVLQPFKRGHNLIPQFTKPCACALLFGVHLIRHACPSVVFHIAYHRHRTDASGRTARA
mmetsp:Transcript_422/g.1230  ORF Transcript_422/g.1230 Transcript_422/m.1230 type:complete len:203 (-) Transcript_422:2831-3439(-)